MELEFYLKKYFDYDNFLPGQKEIIESISSGENVIAILPTGGGKSLCYQLPALLSQKYSIVVSPLIALMKDQYDSLERKNLSSAFISSAMSNIEKDIVLRKATNNEIKILYVSPERLSSEQFQESVANYPPEYLFVDEAHCISEWGQSFRPGYRKIKQFIENVGVKKISAFTATATKEVIDDIIKELNLINPKIFVKGYERKNFSIEGRLEVDKKKILLTILSLSDEPTIVYCYSRKTAEVLAEFLASNDINADYYHAGLSIERRNVVQDKFYENKITTIVATSAFGMGVDKPDIRRVIHYDLSNSIESYYQEIGRAGRDGNPVKAIFFFNREDERKKNYLLNLSSISASDVIDIYNAIFDYSQVAYGRKPSSPLPIDYDFFKKILPRGKDVFTVVNQALNFLEANGILKRTFYETRPKIKFIADAEFVKNYLKAIDDEDQKSIILFLAKKYGAKIFHYEVAIDLKELSDIIELDFKRILSIFEKLKNYSIVEYQNGDINESVEFAFERTDLAKLNIDFNKIAAIREFYQKKLENIFEFALTDDCRMKYILNYFGESNDNYKCGRCDNCLKLSDNRKAFEDYFAESSILCILSSPKSLTIGDLVSILKGESSSSFDRANETFSRFANFSAYKIENGIKDLIARKILNVDKDGTLSIRRYNYQNIKVNNHTIEKIENYTPQIKNKLRETIYSFRKKIAKKFLQNELLILPDKIIEEILEKMPDSKATFLLIEGANENMYNKIGKDIITIISKFKKKLADISIDEERDNKLLNEDLIVLKKLIEQGLTFEEIVEKTNIDPSILSLQIETLINLDPAIDFDALISEQKKSKAFHILSANSDIDLKKLKSRFEGELTFAEARIILALFKRKKENEQNF